MPRERVLFGSDFPLNLYPKLDAQAGMARFVAGRAAQMPAMIFAGNARRLLGR